MPLVTIKRAAGTLTEKQEGGMEASITAVIVAFEGYASA